MSGSAQVGKKLCQLNDGSDHISKMPESVICDILSRLPSKDAMRTSVLSKDWEYKWTSIYTINISDGERYAVGQPKHNKKSFQNFVDKVLFLSQDFKKFRLVCWEAYKFERLELWITTALRRNTQSLELILPSSRDFVLPRSILNNTSLRELKLVKCTFKVPHDIYFANVTYLYLGAVRIMDGLNNDGPIVFTFPVLETCLLMGCVWFVKRVEIRSPILSTLKCESSCWNGSLSEYSINICGARLGKFESSGELPESIILNESQVLNVDFKNHLRDPYQAYKGGLRVAKLLEGFSAITNLQLSAGTCKAIVSTNVPIPKFDKLQGLAMSVCGNAKLLLELLHSAPSLEFLEIEVDGSSDRSDSYIPDVVPQCVVYHLKEIKFTNSYEKPPFYLAQLFLANGLELRKVYLVGKDCPQKFDMYMQLLLFPRASGCLEIIT